MTRKLFNTLVIQRTIIVNYLRGTHTTIINMIEKLVSAFQSMYTLALENLYYNVKSKLFYFWLTSSVAPHKLLKSHNFTPHCFNIYFLIEFKFYSIIKSSIRILTHHIFFNIKIYYSIYKTQS